MDMNYVALISVSTRDVILRVILIYDRDLGRRNMIAPKFSQCSVGVKNQLCRSCIIVVCTAVYYGYIIKPLALI